MMRYFDLSDDRVTHSNRSEITCTEAGIHTCVVTRNWTEAYLGQLGQQAPGHPREKTPQQPALTLYGVIARFVR